jgi:predicted nucleotidyltransferase
MVDATIIEAVRKYLAEVCAAGINARRAVVYGSHVRGESRADSDIDILVIAPEFDRPRDRSLSAILWRLRASTDYRIEPIGVGERQWDEDDVSPIIEIARREGEIVSIQ